jgi:hypothetical protein
MPSTSKKQERLMAAVAHGWKPDKFKGPPVKIAKEFNRADEAKHRKSKLDKWARARNNAKSNVGEYKT